MLSYLQEQTTAPTLLRSNKSDFRNANVEAAPVLKFSPPHFLIYINNMMDLNLNVTLILYADDAVLASEDWIEFQQKMQHSERW